MCGFAGLLAGPPRDARELDDLARAMAQAIRHRGPDDSGTWVDADVQVALSHRRLSILDLSAAGHQPMSSACGRFVLVFNGEIYNHLELRRELEAQKRAPAWRGHSDTETLLACIAAWELPHALRRASGMFAFALWDRASRTLHLARDRMGEKPVYYGWMQEGFAFGSELKALRVHPGFKGEVDRDALALYMQFRSVPAPFSIYKGVHKLQPGCVLTLRAQDVAARVAQIEPYWSLVDTVRTALKAAPASEEESLRELEARLREAVAAQSIADVPLGAFLSGGVDSSLIAALMQSQSSRPVQTFTVGFDDVDFDESDKARAVAAHLGTDHHALRLRPEDARAVIPLLPDLYDEPFADSSQIPTYLVCKAARAHVTVALSGDGGDELFGGYNRYSWGPGLWKGMNIVPFPLRRMAGSAITAIPPSAWNRLGRLASRKSAPLQLGDKAHKVGRALTSARSMDDFYRSVVTEWPLHSGIVPGAGALSTKLNETELVAGLDDPEQRMMFWDALTYLPDDILTKVDRAAMGVSLETRVPFLDPRVVEAAWQLPLHMKIRDGQGKWALRQLLYRHVPRQLIERPKAGFAIPLGDWLRGPLREWADDLLNPQSLQQDGFIDPAPVSLAWAQHLSGRYDCTAKLWTVLMFQAWLKRNR